MKLHLPKQLFTALLAAITLATPATLTLGSAAWGALGYIDEPTKSGDFYAGNYSFVFVWDGSVSDDIGRVLTFYRGSAINDTYGYNAWTLDTSSKRLTVGRGRAMNTVDGATGIDEDTTFTYASGNNDSYTFTTEIEAGVAYYVSVTGGNSAMTPTITKVADAGTTNPEVSYNGNMNGNANIVVASNSNYMVAADSIIWKSASPSQSSLSTATNWTTVQGTAVSEVAGKNLIFDATSTVAKTVDISDSISVASIKVYDNYTFTDGSAEATGSLTVTGDLNIAAGASATFNVATTLSGTVTNNGTLELSGSNSSSIIKTNAAVTKNDDNTVTHTGATINNSGHIDMSGLYIGSGGGVKGDVNWCNETAQYTSLINSIVGGTVLLNSGNFTLQLGNTDSEPAAVDFRAVYTVEQSTDTANDGSLTLANYSNSTLWRVSDGGGLNVNKTLRVANRQDLLIAGGSVTAGDIKLAHDTNGNPGATLSISSGTLKTGTIRVEQHDTGTKQTAITMTGGSLEFTMADAITVEDTSTAPVVSITGGTLKATVCNWTLDATGWNKTPGVSNVTIDSANTHGITLKGVNLGGTITNNSSLSIGAATVAAGSTVSIGGSGITALIGAITNNGSLTLNGTLDVQGVSTMDARPESAATYAGGQVEGNGFRSQEYILIQGGSITYDEGFELLVAGSAVTPTVQSSSELSAVVRDGSFHVFTGAETIESTAATSYYVAEGGTLTFSDALTGARTMDITGTGTVAITIGSTSDHGNTLTASNFNGVLQISKDDAGNGNVSLNDDWLGASASFKLVSGNHWSSTGQNISRAIELAGEGVDDFAFRHNGSLELSGKVTGTYLTAGRNYGTNGVSNADNNLTLSGADSNIQHVTMKGGTLTVNAGMTFGTLDAKAVSLGNGTALNVGSGNVEGLLTLGTNASLTVSNGTLNLLGGVSSAADSADSIALPSITGNVGIASTLQVDGYLTMDGSVTLSGDLATNYTSYKNGTETYMLYALNKETGSYGYVETASGNGFLKVKGASYWLTQGENGGITLNGFTEGQTTVRHGETDYTLYRDNGGDGEGTSGHYYFLVSENTGTVYYVTAESVDVDSAVQGKATGYVLQGGTMKLTAGSVNTSTITYTSGFITLSDGAELVLDGVPAGMTVNSLLSSILSSTSAGNVKIARSGLDTYDGEGAEHADYSLNSAFAGTLELAAGVGFTLGNGNSYSQNAVITLGNLSGMKLNDGSTLYYNASGVTTIKNLQVVDAASATIHFKDSKSDNAVQFAEKTQLDGDLTVSTTHDGGITFANLVGDGSLTGSSGSGTFKTTISSLQYTEGGETSTFTGSLSFSGDSNVVEVSTGTEAAISFVSLSATNVNSLTFDVETDTSIGTLVVATGAVDVSDGKTLALGAGTAEAQKQHSIGTLSAAAAGVTLGDHATLTLGAGSAEAQKQHSIGTLSAAAAGVTLGDYATLTLGGGTAEAQKQHSIGTLTGGAGSYVNLAPHSVLNTITTASGVTLTGSGTYKLASGTSTMTSGMTLGEDWMGTVVVENSTGQKDITKALNALGNSESTVQVTNLEGYFETARSGVVGVVDPNLHLVNGTNGESAIKIVNGNCNGVNAVIAGDISGSGDITHQAWNGANDRYANYEFTGNVTQWTGNFIVGDSSFSGHANVIFSGSATKINAGFRMDDDANKLHLQIGKSDETDKQYEVNGVVSANALTAYQSADFTKEVTVGNAVTVSAGKTATFGSTLTANTVNNSGQIQLGKIVTNGEEKEMQVVTTVAGGTMSKVQMSSTGITGTAQDGSSSISDADIEVLAQDASFTIADMTLSNVKLSAAQGTTVALNNLSGSAELAGAGHFSISGGEAQYTLAMSPVQAQVAAAENEKGSALTLSYASSTAITLNRNIEGSNPTLTLSVDPTLDVNGVFGAYDVTLTLNYTLAGDLASAETVNWQELVGFTGILGDLLTAQTPEATVDLAEGEAAVAAAGTTPTVEYNYTAPQGDAQVGMLVITINGLNVPEPATSTLSLLALAALAARRRRK